MGTKVSKIREQKVTKIWEINYKNMGIKIYKNYKNLGTKISKIQKQKLKKSGNKI
jgi:hypothetical protein